MTNCEAIDILEEVKEIDDSIYAYNPAYTAALDKAIDSLRASSNASCGDTINRQEAIDALGMEPMAYTEYEQGLHDKWIDAKENIEALSSAQPQRMRGRWINEQLIPDDITGHVYGECSICGKLRIVDNFCPNCGADMRKVKNDGQIN